jgi:ABC-type transporter MlaC component
MKTLSTVGLGTLLLLMGSVWAAAEVSGDQVRQTADKLLAILKDPQLKGESKKSERRDKLKEVLYQRFDFTEMAKRSLGCRQGKESSSFNPGYEYPLRAQTRQMYRNGVALIGKDA